MVGEKCADLLLGRKLAPAEPEPLRG
jgi:hypothetical protein